MAERIDNIATETKKITYGFLFFSNLYVKSDKNKAIDPIYPTVSK